MRKKPKGWTNRDFYRHYLYLDISQRVKKTDSVLEIGCGDGKGPAHMGPPMLSERVRKYTAVDKKKWKGPEINSIRGDFFWYVWPEYDRVVALYVIQYVNPVEFFRRVAGVLKPGGVAYFSEGMTWPGEDGSIRPHYRVESKELYASAERDLKKAFKNVEIIGIEDGILVDEIKTGVFAIASN